MNHAERLFVERYFSNPRRNLLRFSFVFMILGILLSVGILSAALNLFEGYERTLKSVLLDSFPHIKVGSSFAEYISPEAASTALAKLGERSEIASATPVLSFSLMAHHNGKVRGSVLTAYGPGTGAGKDHAKYVTQGSAIPSAGSVIVGHYLASELGLALGDTLRTVYPRLDKITPLGMYPNEHNFIIGGIYDSGYYENDRTLIISGMGDARDILGEKTGYNSIELKLKNEYVDDSARLAPIYDRDLGIDLYAAPVANTTLLHIVSMQKWLIFIIFSFLVLIAGINVISSVITLIYDKKNEIAVLKALGAGSATIRNILGYQMAAVSLLSIVLGQLFGWLLSWLVANQSFYRLKGDVYFIDRLEFYVSPLNQVIIFSVAALLILFCIQIPLRRIKKMQVIDLLRNP